MGQQAERAQLQHVRCVALLFRLLLSQWIAPHVAKGRSADKTDARGGTLPNRRLHLSSPIPSVASFLSASAASRLSSRTSAVSPPVDARTAGGLACGAEGGAASAQLISGPARRTTGVAGGAGAGARRAAAVGTAKEEAGDASVRGESLLPPISVHRCCLIFFVVSPSLWLGEDAEEDGEEQPHRLSLRIRPDEGGAASPAQPADSAPPADTGMALSAWRNRKRASTKRQFFLLIPFY